MAKKKKLASNPARGFATTSIASKAKANITTSQIECDSPSTSLSTQLEADSKTASTNDASPTSTSSPAAKTPARNPNNDPQNTEKDLSQLTPDEVQAALEDAELQTLVDKYSAKSARDAARHVTKLQTERRLLRKQGLAVKLHVRRLLGDDLIDRILVLARDEINAGAWCAVTSEAKKEEDVLVRLWTLQKVLLGLGFKDESVAGALDYALRYAGREAGGNTAVWALDECLDWLALNVDEDELPNVELDGDRPIKVHSEIGSETPSGYTSEQSDTDDKDLLPAEPTVHQAENYTEATGEEALMEDVSDLESDLEPEGLLSEYLETKTRLYDVQPELIESKTPKGKPSKKQTTSNINPITPKAKKLMERLQKIESDVLFDSRTADEQWVQRRNQIAQEASDRKRVGLSTASDNLELPKKAQEVQSLQDLGIPIDNTEGSTNESDDDGALGALFGSTTDNEHAVANTSAGTENMTIMDFGKSKGVSPRRILEEACRSRDSGAQFIYRVISNAAFASRYSLTIKWSKSQIIEFPLEFGSVTSTRTSDSNTFKMRTVATSDSRQSESYISVVALFQIFSTSVKEEKVYLRLPAIWRDLWSAFVARRKNEVDATDKITLRRLRDAYYAVKGSDGESDVRAAEQGREGRNLTKDAALNDTAHHISETSRIVDEQRIKDIWTSKSSSASYKSMLPGRTNLPIFQFRDAALSAIEEYQVMIICGETGCGKSTQMPVYILEREMQRGKECKIYCTEPRRISAITLAQRVSQELGESKADLGTPRSLVGYAIRLESQVSAMTRLVYATTGIVLRMLESKDGLKDITHIVIDEVHERSIETDFLLIILRSLIIKRPTLKVILMSATVDAERFSKYFNEAPIFNVPGRTFPVDTKFLEDAIELTGYVPEDNTNGRYDDDNNDEESLETKGDENAERLSRYSPQTRQTLTKIDEYRIDYNLIVALITKLYSDSNFQQYSKAILIFLPGIGEIRQLSDMIHGTPMAQRCVIHALHSAIPSEDQQRAFRPPPRGMQKIVISTNIAETGVTIPDVTCVIDTGKHKEMRFDERRQISRLIESFISRANAKQRRGRAGRVQAGLCFHLFTQSRHDKPMAEEQTPEMLRLSLQDLIMRVKICNLGDIQTALASALDPPSAKNIRRAIDALVEVGALTPKEDLTPLGQQLSKLPLDPYLGKLLLHSAIFGCLDIALTLAAILTSKSPFMTPLNGRQQAAAARAAFATADSDLLTDFNAYASWRRICNSAHAAPASSESAFCRKNMLSLLTLANIEDLKAQLLGALADTGLVTLSPAERSAAARISNSSTGARGVRRFTPTPAAHAAHAQNTDLACALVAASFYPKLLARESSSSSKTWRNVATNQHVSLHPTSILRNSGPIPPGIAFLSFYSIMQGASGARNYNAMALTPAPGLFLVLLAGGNNNDAGVFHDVARVVSLDGARVRFAVEDGTGSAAGWKAYTAIKFLRRRVAALLSLRWGAGAGAGAKARGKAKAEAEERNLAPWIEIWETLLERRCGGGG